jgi:hypothetical protein
MSVNVDAVRGIMIEIACIWFFVGFFCAIYSTKIMRIQELNGIKWLRDWHINMHDLYIGCYWISKQGDTADFLILYFVIFGLVWRWTRIIPVTVIPQFNEKIDPFCTACGIVESAHPLMIHGTQTICYGAYVDNATGKQWKGKIA